MADRNSCSAYRSPSRPTSQPNTTSSRSAVQNYSVKCDAAPTRTTLITEARLSQLFDPIVHLADEAHGNYSLSNSTYRSEGRNSDQFSSSRLSAGYCHLPTTYPAIVEPIDDRSSPNPQVCFSHQPQPNYLSPSTRRLSDYRASVTSQTSSLHTALSELAVDVEVVDMEDGALSNHFSHSNYPDTTASPYGELGGDETMMGSVGREGFWCSDPVTDVTGEMFNDDNNCDDSYDPYVYNLDGDSINWQERCLELEISLQRFRDQAGKIRGLLREKLSEMESRVLEAENRAEIAEEKVRIMEQQLSQSHWSPSEATQQLSSLQNTVEAKERDINRLESQVDEQRKMRLNDAKQVEAKAAKIKEWVTNKLRELEEQNQHLREQNQKCNEQLELLRSRLRQLSQNSSSNKPNRGSTEDSSRGSLEGDQPGSDDSLSRVAAVLEAKGLNKSISSVEASAQLDALYAEVDLTKKNKQRSPCGQPLVGLGLSGPVNSLMQQRFPENRLSLTGLVRNARDSRVDSGSVDMETPLSLSPKSPQTNVEMNELHDGLSKKPIPPPRTRVPRKDSDHSVSGSLSDSGKSLSGSGGAMLPGKSQCPSANTLSGLSDVEVETYDNVATSALGELGQAIDQAIASMTAAVEHGDYDVPKPPRSLKMRPKLVTNEVHDYAEIYTPSKERVPWNSTRHSQQCSAGGSVSDDPDYLDDSKPPTPPLHRFPSWESRIYQAAAEGFSVSEQPPAFTSTNLEQQTPKHVNRLSAAGYQDISIPVYATVKGRASQIRSVPFTGDSSDSSDGEDHIDIRDNCNESGTSDDYALPPDATVPNDADVVTHATSQLRLSTVDSMEKDGYLTKLSGKLKTWRKRWFVLKNGTLSYWKSQNDVGRKVQGQIFLDDTCRVLRADGAATFEISTSKKTYYLTADSGATVEEWVRVLQNAVRRNTTRLLLGREDQKPTMQGWIVKVKHGHSKRCWCVLVGKTFLYFKLPSDQVPQGQINMRDARVEEVDHVSDSDSEEIEGPNAVGTTQAAHLTIGIFPSHQDPTYLLLSNKQEKDSWLYQLTIVSGGGSHNGTQYEQLIQKLMETDGDPNCGLWRLPILLHSKDSITSPLTTLPSESLHNEAIKLFKAIQLFTSVLLDSAGIDYHVVLAQNALQQCLHLVELQPELICALIKQTSRLQPHTHGSKWGGAQVNRSALHKISKPAKPTRKVSLTSTSSLVGTPNSIPGPNSSSCGSVSGPNDSKRGSASFVFVQGWQLLALTVSLFVPKNNKLLWYLRLHLRRNADTKTEVGKYASYCQRALERTLQMGPREAKPSRMEVLSILLKNPYHHSLPHAIPVHFLNGTYQVVGFDGSTTVEEFLIALNQEIGCRDVSQSGFALFSDDPIEKDLEHWLEPRSKLCDVISKWETALREKGLGKFQNTKVIRLTYRHRLYWRNSLKGETERERLLHCYQTAQRIAENHFPLTKELAIELAAIMSQIDGGDYNASKGRSSGGGSGQTHGAVQAVERFIPKRYKDGITPEELRLMADNVAEKWNALKGRSISDCVRIYLTCTRKWPFFGASLFHAKVKCGGGNSDLEGASVWLAVGEEAITLLDISTMHSVARIPYCAAVTFGGCQDDFMVVVNNCDIQGPGTQRMLFALPKPKILELTLLVADYMNVMGCVQPSTPNATLTRVDSRRSGRSKTRERESDRGTMNHRLQASAEPDILRATPEMESKMQQLHQEDPIRRRTPGTES